METLATYADKCFADIDCHVMNECVNGHCLHKDVWPLAVWDVVVWVLIFVISALANAAGVSGGVIIIPIVILLGGFPTHLALPIVNIVAFGGLTVALLYRFRLRHPTRERPRIEYKLALFLCIPLLLGTSYGVMSNVVLPEWLLLGLLVLTLAYVSVQTLRQ